MNRSDTWLIVPALAGALGVLAYAHLTQVSTEPAGRSVTPASQLQAVDTSTVGVSNVVALNDSSASKGTAAAGEPPLETPGTARGAPADSAPTEPQPAPVKSTAQLIEETTSPDPQIRAAAITALAQAPKAVALPALKEILEVGDPQLDRPAAVQSLYTMAVERGDPDGQVRNVLRDAMYHGDDDNVSQGAQAALEDIEIVLAAQPSKPVATPVAK